MPWRAGGQADDSGRDAVRVLIIAVRVLIIAVRVLIIAVRVLIIAVRVRIIALRGTRAAYVGSFRPPQYKEYPRAPWEHSR